MSGRDDYLLDPAGPPDPEIAALERALAPLRWREQPLRQPDGGPDRGPRQAPSRPRRVWPWLAAAAAALLGLGVWALQDDGELLRPDAAPRTFVAGKGEQVVALGYLAEITLRPGSELAFVHWKQEQALFELRRGGLVARVEPPPKVEKGFFVVGTRLGRVVDQGCQYTLDLQPDGSARVQVTEGAVTFEFPERTVFVPAGAATEVDARGPSTPCFDDAEPELRKAVREFDMLRAKGAGFDLRGESLKHVLAAARTGRDTLVLWHLLRDPEEMLRTPTLDHLVGLVGLPPGSKDAPEDPEEWLPFLRLAHWQPAK